MCLTQMEQIVSIVRDAATVIALMVGAAWTYLLFVQNRQKYPRASIEHQITQRRIGRDTVLLHVDVEVSNIGNVLIELVESASILCQVLPLSTEVSQKVVAMQDPVEEPKTEIDWPILAWREDRWATGECEIEPGESQSIQRDFILHGDIRTVEVYSYLMNERKRERKLSWDLSTVYDITDSRIE